MSERQLTLADLFLQRKEIPNLSRELIQVLDEVYPEQSLTRKDIGVDERVLWMDAGRRELISKLKKMLED